MLTLPDARHLADLLVRADEAALAGNATRVHDLLVKALADVNGLTDYSEVAA